MFSQNYIENSHYDTLYAKEINFFIYIRKKEISSNHIYGFKKISVYNKASSSSSLRNLMGKFSNCIVLVFKSFGAFSGLR